MRFLPFILTLAAFGQSLSFGLKGGYHPTGWFDLSPGRDAATDGSTRYTFGPALELRLPFGIGIEADALYRREKLSLSGGILGLATSGITEASAWDFPVLGKLRMGVGPFKPFVAAGPSFRRLGNERTRYTCTGSLCGTQGTREATIPGFVRTGITAGAGAEFKLLGPRVSAELRYTRFTSNPADPTGSQTAINKNQLLVLFGLMF